MRQDARAEAVKIGDLGVHNLMRDVLSFLVENGAIIQPGPVIEVVDVQYRGYIHSQEVHRVIDGYLPVPGQTKCIFFKLQRSYLRRT